MNRLITACILLALGVTLFGLAFGFVYLDIRASDAQSIANLNFQHDHDTSHVYAIVAMCIGPLGAGLALTGGLLGLSALVRQMKGSAPKP